MDSIVDYIKYNTLCDFYCVNIGTAHIREDVPENMQQFSPFFHNLWTNGKSGLIINIDSSFEESYI